MRAHRAARHARSRRVTAERSHCDRSDPLELADIDVPATPGDATPVMQLQRREEGLEIRLGVRPFGAGGPFYLAGQGGTSVLFSVNGQRQRVNRDPDAEKKAVKALRLVVRPCWPGGSAIANAKSKPSKTCSNSSNRCRLRWPGNLRMAEGRGPQGKPHRQRAQKLSIKLVQKRDWFEVSGKIEIDQGLVDDVQEAPGWAGSVRAAVCILPMAGRFIALTEDLQRQLRRLQGVSEEELPEAAACMVLASMAVDDLVESACKVQADKHRRQLSARLRAAGSHAPKVPATSQAGAARLPA